MIYHGKKTIPGEFRRDMWMPYYSVHFADSELGLRAYQLLREFSKQRQLAPPAEMITVTEEYLAQKRPRDAPGAEAFDEKNMKRIGLTMEKKERARVLMDQKATSVADLAAALEMQEEYLSEVDGVDAEKKRGYLTRKARQRRREAFKRQVAKAEERAARVAALEEHLSKISGEEVKIVDNDGQYPTERESIKILWRDLHDSRCARSWPVGVQHGELVLQRSTVIGDEKATYQDLAKDEVVANNEFKERVVQPTPP